MNWFERHLNWSLFFGTLLLPIVVSMVFGAIFAVLFWSQLGSSLYGGEGFSSGGSLPPFFNDTPIRIIGGVIGFAILAFELFVMWWYLGKKSRSKLWMLLYVFPLILSYIFQAVTPRTYTDLSTMLGSAIFGLLLLIVGLTDMIIFYCLKNHSIVAGGDFVTDAVTGDLPYGPGQYGSGQSSSGQYGSGPYTNVYDERLTKELDYTPTKNVLDISGGDGTPGSIYTSDIDKTERAPDNIEARPVSEPLDNVARVISQQRSTLPILLGDSGVPIKCGYHPEGDAVNRCSRCGQYVCADCNYVTGTHPICRNCWEKRAVAPLAPATDKAEKQKSPKTAKQQKGKQPEPTPQPVQPVEEIVPEKSAMQSPAEPPKAAEVEPLETSAQLSEPQTSAQIYEQQIPVPPPNQRIPDRPLESLMPSQVLEPQMPAQVPEPETPAPPLQQQIAEQLHGPQMTIRQVEPIVQPKSAEPIVQPRPVEPAIPPEPKKEEGPAAVEPPKVVLNEKGAKQEAEKIIWQQEFMGLYQQAAPIINVIVKRDAEGMPASPLDLMEGLKLRPMLDRVRKLSKPKDKDMREAKSELEHLLSQCIKIADAAANFVSSGGQALLGGPDFKKIVSGIESADGLLDKLSERTPGFARPEPETPNPKL